ncbi:non-ribosomal peptide synthetase [Streptomyces sp. SID5643]|uniref:non-ribosomal peptide synthetase n=1 Tax=Streptomyces sp. SID5643 TaxID=2690307 RepID=UPI00136EB925|nr:non-ribosomal peptide synthetase [Streptomyces sp. SID5643]MZF89093.1 amino acid adenylation domain-containing protein [Streptomyces sp. SID5643]
MTTGDGSHERRIEELMALRGLRRPAAERSAGSPGLSRGPLAPGQERLWMLDQLHPGSCQYNIPMAWRIEGDLDEDGLSRGLRELCRRHEALRTVFHVRDGRPEQRVVDDLPVLVVEDLGSVAPQERHRAVADRLRADAGTPFDLTAGPAVRMRLYRHDDHTRTLSITVHHIVFDDWSSTVLERDLAALCRAAGAGGLEHAQPLPTRYLDWVVRERERIPSAEQLEYWRTRLDGAPATIELPVDSAAGDGPAPALQETVAVAQEDIESLDRLARSEGATSFMVMLAAWSALLHRASGQTDLVIGTPYALRESADTHELIGFFLNTLALRTDLAGDPSFRQLLARTRSTATDAFARSDVPFDSVVQALSPERAGARHPLFQVWFATDSADGAGLDLPGVTCTRIPLDGGEAKFDLALFVTHRPDATELVLEFDSSLFERAAIAYLGRQLGRLITSIAAEPDLPLSAHDLFDPGERELVLRTWNATDRPYQTPALVHHWFEQQAARTPDATAVEFGDERVTYVQLDRRADAVAQALRRAGAGHGVYVGIALRRSVDMVAAVLGTLKAQAAYVALDLSHPEERVALLLEDTGAPVVLVDGTTAQRLPHTPARRIDMAGIPQEPDAGGAPGGPGATAGSVAYVTYTSGSTGRPKGILMSHRAVGNLVAWQLDRYGPWQPGYRTLQFASLSFDVSFQEIFSSLATGGTLVLITEDERRDVHGLAALLNRRRVQRLFIPAAALQQVAEGFRASGLPPRTLDTVIAGSEQLVVTDDLRELFAALPEGRLHNEYGPSETHVTTAHTLPADPAQWPSWVPIGRPIANTRVYVLDAQRNPTPVGSRGEVYIGGIGLAHGYLGRPDLTTAAFVPDPYAPEPGARMYRTGDIARHLPNGDLEFLGRTDGQVKIRGFRVELGEVQANLDAHPGVRSAFVRVDGQRSDQRRLVAYVVPATGQELDAARLRAFLQRRLPDYMIPSAFVLLDRFPLTVNGKVDQRGLPEPDFAAHGAADTFVEPRDALEKEIAAEWEALLSVPRVGRDDDFFSLGGHSLLATRLLWSLRARLSVELALGEFYRLPTVAGLAGSVRRAQADRPATADGASDPPQGAEQRLDALFDDLLGPADR